MANQSPDRREVLNMLARVAAISQFPGFCRWMFAGGKMDSENAAAEPYRPLFFTAAEYRLVEVLCDLIIPADESPGARAAGVSEFVDFMTAHDDELQYPLRSGLAWLDAVATAEYGRPFAEIPAGQQQTLLTPLAYRDKHLANQEEGQQFFTLLRKYTVIGYYTSRVGLEQLDYPGLRLYSSSPECPHKDDPEHKHLTGRG